MRSAAGDRLMLWDTPGFGDSVRLQRRLAASGQPVGWFLSQVWDRFADRAFWCSQQALRAARDSADVVLYVVNATEDPAAAGYIEPELRILDWLGKPALLLLNQLGTRGDPAQDQQLAEQWGAFLRRQPTTWRAADPVVRCLRALLGAGARAAGRHRRGAAGATAAGLRPRRRGLACARSRRARAQRGRDRRAAGPPGTRRRAAAGHDTGAEGGPGAAGRCGRCTRCRRGARAQHADRTPGRVGAREHRGTGRAARPDRHRGRADPAAGRRGFRDAAAARRRQGRPLGRARVGRARRPGRRPGGRRPHPGCGRLAGRHRRCVRRAEADPALPAGARTRRRQRALVGRVPRRAAGRGHDPLPRGRAFRPRARRVSAGRARAALAGRGRRWPRRGCGPACGGVDGRARGRGQ